MAQKNSDDKKSTGQKKFRPKLAEIIPPLDFSFMNLRTVEEALEYDCRPNGALTDPYKIHGYLVKGAENIDKMPMPEDGSRPKSWSHSFKLCQNIMKSINGIGPVMEKLFFEPQNVTWIDLSFNLIENVEDALLAMEQLQIIYLHGNRITVLQEVDKFTKFKKLMKLTLYGNPIDNVKGYRSYVLDTLPQLIALDFTMVSRADRRQASTFHKMVFHKVDPKAIRRGDDDDEEEAAGGLAEPSPAAAARSKRAAKAK